MHFHLSRQHLLPLARAAAEIYPHAKPFPHALFDGFLGLELAQSLAARFPRPDHPGFRRKDYKEQSGRLGQLQRHAFEGVDPAIRHLLAELCGMVFLDFLSQVTGVDGLIADPHFRGAGPSITLPGGHLGLHADFNRDRVRHLERKVTVLYYVGDEWDSGWGGDLELWNETRSRCEARYAPILDRLVVMAHGDAYWHGHPAPLACPDGRFRASIAAYYYVATPPANEEDAHGAIWAAD